MRLKAFDDPCSPSHIMAREEDVEEGEVQSVSSAMGNTEPSKKVRILPRCALLSDFDLLEKVGEGTFGYNSCYCANELVRCIRQGKRRRVKSSLSRKYCHGLNKKEYNDIDH
jgi:hypothetical protein